MDNCPAGVIRLRIRGAFRLKMPAQYIDPQGWQVFQLNEKTVDWTDAGNAARAQVFPGTALPEIDPVFEQIMADRKRLAAQRK